MILKKCDSFNAKGIICKKDVEIISFLQRKYLAYWIEQKNYDMNNYESPISSKLNYFWRGLSFDKCKATQLYIQKSEILTNDDYFFSESNNNKIETISFDYREDDDYDEAGVLFYLSLYSSPKIRTFERKYQKFYDLIASLGGIMKIFTFLFSFFVQYLHDWSMKEKILRKFYIFTKIKENHQAGKLFSCFLLIYYQFNKGNSNPLCEPSSIESNQRKRIFQKLDIKLNLWEKTKFIFHGFIKNKEKTNKLILYTRLLKLKKNWI